MINAAAESQSKLGQFPVSRIMADLRLFSELLSYFMIKRSASVLDERKIKTDHVRSSIFASFISTVFSFECKKKKKKKGEKKNFEEDFGNTLVEH